MEKAVNRTVEPIKKLAFILLSAALVLSTFGWMFAQKANADGPIVITTAEELNNIRHDMGNDYVLGADIDLGVAPYNDGVGWVPIGDYWNDSFSGTFDGKGYTIKGLTIDRSSLDGASTHATGLFGHAKGTAKFSNVKLENVDIVGKSNTGALVGEIGQHGLIENVSVSGKVSGVGKVGGVVGWLSNAIIKNSHMNGTVYGGNSHNNDIGGLVGSAGGEGSLIENSKSAGTVESSGMNVGGLAGRANNVKNSSSSAKVISHRDDDSNAGGLIGNMSQSNNFEVTNSFATGDVTAVANNVGGLIGYANAGVEMHVKNSYATGTVNGKNHVGGLIGHQRNKVHVKDSYSTSNVSGENYVGGLAGVQESKETTTQKSYATGKVTAAGNNAGGLVGELKSQAKIEDSYARGAVTGAGNVGGLVGQNSASVIERTYATGKVTGQTETGGLVGKDVNGKYSGTAANYYDQATTAQGDSKGASGKSTAAMKTQSTFVNWNFNNTWAINEGVEYPVFRNQPLVVLTDIRNHWAQAQIEDAVARGLITGFDDKTFKPEDPITRAQFVVIISRAITIDGSGAAPSFTDSLPSWAKAEIEAAFKAGIITGYDDGTFRPNKEISREEIAAMVARAFDLQRKSSGGTGFSDDSQIQGWAKEDVAKLRENGIVEGKGGNTFAPKAKTKRAEGTVILLRTIDLN